MKAPPPTFDADGYPTDESLDALSKWPTIDVVGWLCYARSMLSPTYSRYTELPDRIEIATGGWSGNESVIQAMRQHIFWSILWRSSHRGGLHVFDIPPNW